MIAVDRTKGHGEKRSRKCEQAISSLLVHASIEEAACHAGVSTPTLRRWLKEPAFAALYQQARHSALSQSIAVLHVASQQAAKALQEVIADSTASPSVRVSAARIVLEMALKGMEVEQIVSRVEALELLVKTMPTADPSGFEMGRHR